jgi:hypothetical protein
VSLARTFRSAALVAALSLALAAFGHELFYAGWVRRLVAVAPWTQQTTPAALDGQIRAALPAGSSRNAVESLLRSKDIRYRYVSAGEIHAVARNLKGSNALTQEHLELRFAFDEAGGLESIDSRVANEGP